jgi:glycopeptide antibiotics resistance protein
MMNRLFAARTIFVLAALFIVYATSVPFDFSRAPTLADAEWIPFWDLGRNQRASIPDVVQNIALFLPYGFFAILAFPALYRRGLVLGVLFTALLGTALSLGVEIIQTMSAFRTTSATDLVTNTAGAGAGALGARIYEDYAAGWARKNAAAILRTQPGLLIVLGFAVATFFAMLAPFLPSLDVGMTRAKVRLLIDHPLGTKPIGSLLFDAVLFAGLAFAATLELPAYAAKRGWLPFDHRSVPAAPAAAFAAALVGAWAIALEAAQLPLIHHNPGLREALVNVAGAGGGALAALLAVGAKPIRAEHELGRWTRRWAPLVLAFAVVLPAVRALAPFQLREAQEVLAELEWRRFLPFWSLFVHLTMSTFTNVFEAAATYLPLGYALAALGRRGATVFLVALLLAEPLELAQLAIEGRTFDVTEGLLAATGALAGAWLFRRLLALAEEIK